MGTLYISDFTGVRYSVSLLGHVTDSNSLTDFENLGIYGVYIANIYEEERRKQYERIY